MPENEANMNLRLQHLHVFITCLASSRVKFDKGWTSHTMCGARLLGYQQESVFIAREQNDKKDKSLLKFFPPRNFFFLSKSIFPGTPQLSVPVDTLTMSAG
jgi:hypothetical protein